MDGELIFLVVEWLEQGTMDIGGGRFTKKHREVFTPADYPKKLMCHNPNCKGGGFAIGVRIADLLSSGEYSDHNSLICSNAIHSDRTKRCLHTIIYSITRVLPYPQAEQMSVVVGRRSGIVS